MTGITFLDALQCPYCGHAPLDNRGMAIRCSGCGLEFPRRAGVIDTLVRADAAVLQELEGMRGESAAAGKHFARLEDFTIQHVAEVQTHAQREAWNAVSPVEFFLSTRLNLEQALRAVDLRGGRRVLEIGAQNRFEPLQRFRELGFEEAYAVNIYYLYSDDTPLGPWPCVLLADMNRLPFRDGYFDVVFACATTHHSPDLDRTLAEIARVLAPGGHAILINDPTNGPLKHIWDWVGHAWGWTRIPRHELVNEHEYTSWHYRRLFRRHRLQVVRSMFSAYYDRKLRQGGFHGVRWAALAWALAGVWRIPGAAALLRRCALRPGQFLLGLELNVVLRKFPPA